jgi:hypothetical protein
MVKLCYKTPVGGKPANEVHISGDRHFRARIFNLSKTWSHIHHFLSTHRLQGYERGLFIKMP